MSVEDLRHLLAEELELLEVAERLYVLYARAMCAEGTAGLAVACADTKRRMRDYLNMPDAIALCQEAEHDTAEILADAAVPFKVAMGLVEAIRRKHPTPFIQKWGTSAAMCGKLIQDCRIAAAAHLVKAEKCLDPHVLGADGKAIKS